MKPHPSLAGNLDSIDDAIVGLARRMNGDTHELLVLLRTFDEAAGWLKWGAGNCAEWLHWRCDLSPSAAREKVRVAHAIATLPLISTAFASGRLSYSKVRAMTRIATPENEATLLDLAWTMTAAHVEQHCRQRRNATAESIEDARSADAARSFRSWRNERTGQMTIMLQLPIADGQLLERAVDKACVDQTSARAAPDDTSTWASLQADAVVTIAKAYLAGSGGEDTASNGTVDHYQVVVHVDHDALTGRRGLSELPIETVRRLCCDGSLVPVVENGDGDPLNVGRRQRVVSTAIRRALWARDRMCTFPGCTHRRFVDAHHVRHWSDGGETSLENLVLLCSAHHRLMHEGGYRIDFDDRGKPRFLRPDGLAVPVSGYRSEGPKRPQDSAEASTAAAIVAHDPLDSPGFMTAREDRPPAPHTAGSASQATRPRA
ncbi:MAG: DUF222 domain-containing protein [Lautropia sp.]